MPVSRARLLPLWACLAGAASDAQENAQDPQTVRLFEGPRHISTPAPQFPSSAAMQAQEGWVEFNFMINPDGKAYEIYVTDNVGADAFIESARSALEEASFEPARYGDEIISSSSQLRYTFILEDRDNAARRRFTVRYRDFIETLQEKPQTEAENELLRLEAAEIRNHYEYSYLSLARYFYAERYGTTLEQMRHLRQALGESITNPELESALEDSVLTVRRGLLELQLRNSYFGEALDTLELMRAKGDIEGIELFHDVIERVNTIVNGDEVYGVAGEIRENGSWQLQLLRSRFYLDDLTGNVEELKLRCERGFVFFEFDPERLYALADTAGTCWLEVIGDPGTRFTLVQG